MCYFNDLLVQIQTGLAVELLWSIAAGNLQKAPFLQRKEIARIRLVGIGHAVGKNMNDSGARIADQHVADGDLARADKTRKDGVAISHKLGNLQKNTAKIFDGARHAQGGDGQIGGKK